MEQRPKLELTGSRLFTAWLAQGRASLAFTTYQAGKLFRIGLKPDGRLSIFERTFSRCISLGATIAKCARFAFCAACCKLILWDALSSTE
jgi:hypothetical protein